MAAASRARVREIVLVNRNRARAKGVATDMHYGAALSPLVMIRDGDYADLADAGVAIITAGINEKAGGATDRSDPAGRLRLLDANVKVFQDIVPKLVKAAPNAVIVVATDPPIHWPTWRATLAGHDRIVDTGTYLDSLRFRLHVAERLGVGPDSVEANVVGEHGTSSVFLWSTARIGGMPVRELLARRKIEFDDLPQGRRAGRALRQHHHHRRHRRQPVRHRHGLSAHRRGDPARRARGLPRRFLQSALRHHGVAAEHRRPPGRDRGAASQRCRTRNGRASNAAPRA